MSIKGSPYIWFARSLDAGSLTGALAAAAELHHVGLADALRLVRLMARAEDHRFSRAAARGLGRLIVETRGLTLGDADEALDALERLPDQPADALATLRGLCVHLDVPDAERLKG